MAFEIIQQTSELHQQVKQQNKQLNQTEDESSVLINPKWIETLTTKSIESASLALQSIDDIHGSDCFPASVLRVGHGVANDVLEEDLENATGLLVDQAADALHAATASQAAYSRLRDALNVVT
ncbi:hypothetical protein KSP40_PGU013925 [Platanthera guangdongensis]|uniref:Uncharacterized protein n=1 Tax=Platanthera guangdongensis TaxID=2320717 RepID=A0ABR2LN43_9ASPA